MACGRRVLSAVQYAWDNCVLTNRTSPFSDSEISCGVIEVMFINQVLSNICPVSASCSEISFAMS